MQAQQSYEAGEESGQRRCGPGARGFVAPEDAGVANTAGQRYTKGTDLHEGRMRVELGISSIESLGSTSTGGGAVGFEYLHPTSMPPPPGTRTLLPGSTIPLLRDRLHPQAVLSPPTTASREDSQVDGGQLRAILRFPSRTLLPTNARLSPNACTCPRPLPTARYARCPPSPPGSTSGREIRDLRPRARLPPFSRDGRISWSSSYSPRFRTFFPAALRTREKNAEVALTHVEHEAGPFPPTARNLLLQSTQT
ncbi:hypothetical protein K438DRAFT_1989869 [Mycena galopus ATCC 62051]|nr:hypothetical protein K438DRAFT_1989869 [Mycena galopus ATCC 62051]